MFLDYTTGSTQSEIKQVEYVRLRIGTNTG
jgi:hypothetical protein